MAIISHKHKFSFSSKLGKRPVQALKLRFRPFVGLKTLLRR